MMKYFKLEKKELNNLRKEVKIATKYNINQIDIVAYGDNFIDYNIYKNFNNDFRLGIQPIASGRITR